MSEEIRSTFEASLQGTATLYRTSAATFADTIETAVDQPAVGTALPFADVTLADTSVAVDPSPAAIEAAETGVTPAGMGVANYGTVSLPSGPGNDELLSLYVPQHVAVLAASDLVADMPAAYERLSEEIGDGADTQILATGPSATADMGTLVEGVHGPHETHVVLLEDR